MTEAMWTCSHCNEVIQDQFDACRQCGCSRDGKLNLNFTPEPPTDAERNPSSFEAQFAAHFVCARCRHREARVERVRATGVGFAQILRKDFLTVSCSACGLTEFYNLSVLEGRSDLQNFLRGLLGT